jgi:predicted small integral membrane protein
MIAARYAKALMVFGLGLFGLLVGMDNIIDYPSNWAFVQHVLSMDTVFPDNTLKWRAITSPQLQALGYWGIIAGELLTGLCFMTCAIQLVGRARGPAARFQQAKRWGVAGAALGFAVWYIGFMVVGGEWFSMWQSKDWNGQESAFTFYMTIMVVLIFLMQADAEIDGVRPPVDAAK